MAIDLRVNGQVRALDVDPATPLIAVLRNDLGLNGPKLGCGLGQCGACTVLIGDRAARACQVPVGMVGARAVTTLDGLTADGRLHAVQRAFIDKAGAQCGYCLNGMILTTLAFLKTRPDATEAEIRQALRFNICRCGTHLEILASATEAARLLAEVAP